MISSKLGHRLDSTLATLIKVVFRSNNLNPTYFTLLGLLVNILAAAAFVYGNWPLAGFLVLSAGLFARARLSLRRKLTAFPFR